MFDADLFKIESIGNLLGVLLCWVNVEKISSLVEELLSCLSMSDVMLIITSPSLVVACFGLVSMS